MRQQARINSEVAIRHLQADLPPSDQLLDRLREIETLAVYGQPSEYTLNEIAKLSAAAICAAREVKRK